MSKALKLVPGRRHPHRAPQGDTTGSKRRTWHEIKCPQCEAITKGSRGFIRRCMGGARNETNGQTKRGCGKLFAEMGLK